LLWGLIGTGILLHSTQYIFNRSLYVDEAALTMNILSRSFSELLQPLDYGQAAPVGFLLIERFLVQLLGDSEYVLRLFPFFTALLAIGLFYYIASHWVRSAAVPVALGLFVLSEPLIFFSSTVKQHSSDVFFALLIYVVTKFFLLKELTISRIVLFGVTGALAIWCSHPAVFILASISLVIGILYIVKKEWRKLGHFVIICSFWGINFLATYIVSLQNLTHDENLLRLSAKAFMPLPFSLETIIWIVKPLLGFVGFAIGLSQAIYETIQSHSIFRLIAVIPELFTSLGRSNSLEVIDLLFFSIIWGFLYLVAIFFCFVGGIRLFSKNKITFFLLTSPLFFAFLANGLQKFPFLGRLRLFLIPFVILFIGEGVVQIRGKTKQKYPLIGVILIIVLFVYPAWSGGYHLIKPRVAEEAKSVLQYVKERKQEGDMFYVYYATELVFQYYSKRFGFDNDEYIIGVRSRDNWNNYIRELEQLRGKKRVWILFSHMIKQEEMFFLYYLEKIGGKQLDSFQGIKAAAYLYDLSQS
jgi:hypothetical protein